MEIEKQEDQKIGIHCHIWILFFYFSSIKIREKYSIILDDVLLFEIVLDSYTQSCFV
jgi:hypothetical protein